MPEWPYSRDDRWVFEPAELGTSGRVVTNLRSNISVWESSANPLGYGRGVLQRGNSAPSILFENSSLADLINAEEVVTLLADSGTGDSFRDRDDDPLTWARDNLAPVVDDLERDPRQQVDTENIYDGAASSSLDGCNGQFLVSQAGFERRLSTISTPTIQSFGPNQVVVPRSLKQHQDGHGANIPGESISDTSEERYGDSNSTMADSAFPAPHHQLSYQLGIELPASDDSGLWNYPTTPGMLEGTNNQLLGGMGEIMANIESPGWQGINISTSAARPSTAGSGVLVEPAPPNLLPGSSSIRHSSLPAKLIRANRGHATNPRSVAERVRRGKISERIRKLQDLVPNMEPQTNTSAMLDEVVEYVKQLKLQVQELSETVDQLQVGSRDVT